MSLFLRPTDPFLLKWEGEMVGFENAKEIFGADEVRF
jgi:hypothetical protein